MWRKKQQLSLGSDIIEIKRIQAAITRYGQRFLDKIFTVEEQRYCERFVDSARHYAARFAAKEAIAKALVRGFQQHFSWKDMEIINDADGKPHVFFSQRLQQYFPKRSIELSLSHCREYAIATALLI